MKQKSVLCSTGHGTGVLDSKPPSWPRPKMHRARPHLLVMRDRVVRGVIADNREKKREIRKLDEKLKAERTERQQLQEDKRRLEADLARATDKSIAAKFARGVAAVKSLFGRKPQAIVYRNKT